jgi:hypothetical protein
VQTFCRVVLAILLLAAAVLFASSSNAADERTYPKTFLANPSDVEVIRSYVRKRKHWHSSQYRIQPLRREDGYFVYEVVYLKDLERHFVNGKEVFEVGGGKSFAAYYDRGKRRVVKEMYFQ